MKKIGSILLSAFLIFSLLSAFPAAAAGGIVGSVGTTDARQGDTVTLTVNLTANPGFSFLSVTPKFDTAAFTVTAENGTVCPSFTSGKNYIWNASGADITVTGVLLKLTVKIHDDAAPKEYSLSLAVRECYNNAGQDVSCIIDAGKIRVSCKNHTYGAYSKANDGQHQRTCSVCGYVETSNHTWNSGTVTKPATCKESGTKVFSCTACGAEKTETVAKTNAHTWGEWHITKQPTCTTPGTTTKTCSVCGKTEDQTVGATGHSMGGWTQSKAPTCTENGEEKRSCSKCSYVETRTVNALGHSFSNPTVTKQPTCTEPGIESGKCSRCGQTTTNTIKAKGHSFGAWSDTKAATCTEGGTQERKCSACDAVESRTTKALGHDFENPTIVKEATISSTGLKEGKCKRCGETTSEVIPCSAKDETTGTVFEADEGVFEAGTELGVEEISEDNPSYASAENVLKESCSAFKLYSLTATQNGAATQPNGEVTVTLPIPDGFGTDVALYLLAEDGTAEKIEAVVSEDGKTISAKLTKLGELAIAKLGEGTPAGADDNAPTDTPVATKNHTVLYIVLIVVVLGAGAAVAVVLIKKKRAKTELL